MMKSHYSKQHIQKGGALIMLVLVVVIVGTASIFSVLDGSEVKIERDKKTLSALSEAKLALIGRAVADANHPGSLPCPDGDANGEADPFVANLCPNFVGRYPWKTLGTGQLVDGSGELLWYAVSQSYRDHVTAEPINGVAPGNLIVDGAGDQVAVIFSPGQALDVQVARPSNNVADYLEGENADGDTVFSRQLSSTRNDLLIAINRAELIALVSQRILREVKGDETDGMQDYYIREGMYPYADSDNDGNADTGILVGTPSYQAGLDSLFFNAATKTMLLDNGWFSLLNYSVANTQDSAVLSINGKTLSVAP